jgi:hypothetical protein
MNRKYNQILDRLIQHIESEEFRGYDPYDILNASFPFRFFGTYFSAVATQLHKRNPINFRPLLGIKKDYNPKALGLLVYAYSGLQQLRPNVDYEPQLLRLIELLRQKRSPGYSGVCWGYNFAWASPGKFLPAFAPSGVVTSFVAKGLFSFYRLTGQQEAKELLISAAEFVDKDLAVTQMESGICISYTPFQRDCCYNASLLAAEVLAMAYSLNGNEAYRKKAVDAVRFVITKQHSDGRWNYSLNEHTGAERTQIDFHQGYVIDSIIAIQQLTGVKVAGADEAVIKGLAFYQNQQFISTGQSLWRFPAKYPVDIHHQSQGIITFSKHKKMMPVNNSSAGSFAHSITDWTINNLFDAKKGYFYYRKYPLFTNKIPYIRWSNAWMMVALVELLSIQRED